MNRIVESLLSNLPKETRSLDLELIRSFIKENDMNVLSDLATFQNEDGGFGHGLEADTMMPSSSIVNTNMAVNILNYLSDSKRKKKMILDILKYYENTYIDDIKGWKMITKEVDDYPHAIWWNYESLDSFPWQNPNLEIIGFLNQYKKFVKKLDVELLTNHAIKRLFELNNENCSMHTLLSALRFYKRVDKNIQTHIFNHIDQLVEELVEFEQSKWKDYVLEPYKVLSITTDFMKKHQDAVKINIDLIKKELKESYPLPKWTWYQYEDVFEEQKYHWIGNLAFEMLEAMSNFK